MAAIDTPWLDLMSSSSSTGRQEDGASQQHHDPNPPTVANFSPVTLSNASSASKHRSTILVHQKSPLLIATPPQVTRALAYSHPFLLPLNRLAGLLTWTTGDPWESFLLVASFWAITLYGDVVIRYTGPIVVVAGLIVGMYTRRYSPLSSTGWTGEKQKPHHKREDSEITNTKHQKTLDEIVETLKVFTSRCNVLLDPMLQLTDFLSTQRSATSATTRPALTTLFIRILLVTPLWIFLTLPFIHVVTTKRVILVSGTLFLTWHSQPNRISRAILWRSALIRQISSAVTGLRFTENLAPPALPPRNADGRPPLPPRGRSSIQSALQAASLRRKTDGPGVRFTFILYENQRRWIGLGWTYSLFAYERAAWTDEHLNAVPAKEDFELPEVEGGDVKWRWVEGSQWLVEGAGENDEGGTNAKADSNSDGGTGWIYYDNKWQNGRRGHDSWGRYTRRRKWYRDAELVEFNPDEITPTGSPEVKEKSNGDASTIASTRTSSPPPEYAEAVLDDGASGSSAREPIAPFRRRSDVDEEDAEDARSVRRSEDWGIADEARMGLE